jgi:DNA adenine methylase
MEIVKPFLKWVGGKTQIIQDVLALFPTTMVNYHEPFLGGGSVLLAFLSKVRAGQITVSGKVYASDLNSNLIGLYKNVQVNPAALIAEVRKLMAEFAEAKGVVVNRKATTLAEAKTSPESYYFWTRAKFNALEDRTTVQGSAMLLFMNKTCFRGVYREGPHGFNVPYGNNKNPSIIDDAHIMAVSALIKDVVFVCGSFTETLLRPVAGDFVYLDPPYAPQNATSFVSYTADGFGAENHEALFTRCETLRLAKVKLLMSNADVKLVKDAFVEPAYQTKIVSCRRAIHSTSPDARANEVLIASVRS